MKVIKMIFTSLFFVIITLTNSWAITLDRTGTGQNNPDYFTCTNIVLDGAAGGKPNFSIPLRGLCAVHPGDGLAGWTPLDWSAIKVKGTYNYDTQVAKETIWDGPDIIFEVDLNCKKNPWAHGAYFDGKTCSVIGSIKNDVATNYVVINTPYPLSAKYIDNSLRSSLYNWETKPPEDLLTDWNPYGGPNGTGHIKIVKPANYENINATLPYFLFEFAIDTPHAQLGGSAKIEVEQLEIVPEVIGDIAMPSAGGQWWQSMWNGKLPIQEWPMGISQGLFSGKTGQFRIRAMGKKKSSYASLGGWSSWTYFCIGVSEGCQITLKQLDSITQATKANKIAIAKGMFKTVNNENKKSLVSASKINKLDSRLLSDSSNSKAKVSQFDRVLINKISKKGQPDTHLYKKSGQSSSKPEQVHASVVLSEKLTAIRPKAKIMVERVAYKPAPLTTGKVLGMDILFKNIGSVDSDIEQTYRISCVVLTGGACPVANSISTIGKVIQAEGSTSIILMGVNKAEAGRFAISVVITGQVGRPYSLTVEVKSPLTIKNIKPGSVLPGAQKDISNIRRIK